MEVTEKPTKLTNLQLELLKIFSVQMSEEQLLELKDVLSNFFLTKAREEADRQWDEKGWTQETMKQWLTEHYRTPYK
ncbi:MAG TPA: hypothetical protein VE978_06300 [Chitinophagales bacterium]|nr:hypothetical protein [Chitinophagales bacterium]